MTLAPILPFEDWIKEAASIVRPPFCSQFGGVRWREVGKTATRYDWLVKGMLAAREVSFLAGPSQSGKSFLATDLSLAIARGIPWFGRKTLRGAVVYVAAESSQGVIAFRLPAYAIGHGLTFDGDDLPFLTLRKSPNFFRDHEGVERLITEISAYERDVEQKVELVVIDTFSAATRGADEIKGVDISKIRERIQAIVERCVCAALIVHHMNASGERMRGHSSLMGDVNDVITCQEHEARKDALGRKIRIARADKVKEGQNKITFEFVLRGVEIGVDQDGERITSCIVEPPARAEFEEAEGGDKAFEFRNDHARLLFSCLVEVLRNEGAPPRGGMTVPAGQRVVEVAKWLELYAKRAPQGDEHDADKRRARVQRAVDKAIERFMAIGLIGHDTGLVWLTGRPVRGFRTSPAGAVTLPSAATSAPPTNGNGANGDDDAIIDF